MRAIAKTVPRAARLIEGNPSALHAGRSLRSFLLGSSSAASLTLLANASLAAMPAHAADVRGSVLSIGDGDTLRLRGSAGVVTVRLACIDAPESSQGPWGPTARRELQALLPMGKAVELKAKATDRYGRNVAEVFSGGRNINQALVASGAVFVYWQYIAGCDRNSFSRLETDACQRRLGAGSTPGRTGRQ